MDISLDLTQVIIAVVTLLAGWITKELTGLWAANKEKIREGVKNDQLFKYIDLAGKTVTDVVLSLNQSVVNDMKAKAEDGKLTEEEILEIKDKALSLIQSSLSDSAVEALSTVYKDLPTVYQIWIEKAVSKSKANITIKPFSPGDNTTFIQNL